MASSSRDRDERAALSERYFARSGGSFRMTAALNLRHWG